MKKYKLVFFVDNTAFKIVFFNHRLLMELYGETLRIWFYYISGMVVRYKMYYIVPFGKEDEYFFDGYEDD